MKIPKSWVIQEYKEFCKHIKYKDIKDVPNIMDKWIQLSENFHYGGFVLNLSEKGTSGIHWFKGFGRRLNTKEMYYYLKGLNTAFNYKKGE